MKEETLVKAKIDYWKIKGQIKYSIDSEKIVRLIEQRDIK
jgi:hypothetical protein